MATRRVVNAPRPAAPPAPAASSSSPVADAMAAKVGAGLSDLVRVFADDIDAGRMNKAASMLRAERFELFSDVQPTEFVGVVKSQTDASLFYACSLNAGGDFCCCTQNLNACGGLRGALCKHLMVMLLGLCQAKKLDVQTATAWAKASTQKKPALDKTKLGEVFVRYKAAEAGTVDWRPTETLPEDFMAL